MPKKQFKFSQKLNSWSPCNWLTPLAHSTLSRHFRVIMLNNALRWRDDNWWFPFIHLIQNRVWGEDVVLEEPRWVQLKGAVDRALVAKLRGQARGCLPPRTFWASKFSATSTGHSTIETCWVLLRVLTSFYPQTLQINLACVKSLPEHEAWGGKLNLYYQVGCADSTKQSRRRHRLD